LQLAQAVAIATAVYPVVAVLGRTLRWRVSGYRHYEAIRLADQQPVMAFWHGRILPATYFFRGRGIVVMISDNFDGEWIGRLIQKFGFGLARGSTSHGGRRALVQLRREMRSGKPAGFAIDGPRGPARVAQPGAVWLSSLTGNPILPFHFEAARAWDLASWDGMQVPRPFSHVALAIGEPIHVPPGASAAQLEADRIELERSLAVLVERTGEMLAGLDP
jgi:hypothetical protein